MPVERITYKNPFYKGSKPQWVCPTCGKGILKGVKGSFRYRETKQSINYRELNNECWDPEGSEYTYSCSLVCTNPQCNEIVSNIGTGSVGINIDCNEFTGEQEDQNYYDYFEPKFFWPHLKIFEIPKNTPKAISDEINKSFELFFASPSASSSQVRIALEKILDHLKIKRCVTRNKKRVFISLHERISLLPPAYDDLKDLFFAIKWLGNAGSHSHNITIDDVMDAYDILETSLNEIFEEKIKSIKRLAKQINSKKGPKGSKK